MGFFGKKEEPTMDELENTKERAIITEEILTKEAESEERRAVISELKAKYGKGWKKLLGANNMSTLSTLRSFLRTAKGGMETQTARDSSTPIGRMSGFKGITKA